MRCEDEIVRVDEWWQQFFFHCIFGELVVQVVKIFFFSCTRHQRAIISSGEKNFLLIPTRYQCDQLGGSRFSS